MKSLLLYKTNSPIYEGISRVLNYIGITTTRDPGQQGFDIIICDSHSVSVGEEVAKRGGYLFSGDLNYAVDVLKRGKKREYIKCDVAFCGGWGHVEKEYIPQLSCLNNPFSFKFFTDANARKIEGYFYNQRTIDICQNSVISFITQTSRPEHLWESILCENTIITTDPSVKEVSEHIILLKKEEDIKDLIFSILMNPEYHTEKSKEAKELITRDRTYFHECRKILNTPTLQELLMCSYEKNRIYSRQSSGKSIELRPVLEL